MFFNEPTGCAILSAKNSMDLMLWFLGFIWISFAAVTFQDKRNQEIDSGLSRGSRRKESGIYKRIFPIKKQMTKIK
jgi:hypothetical protein